jgi:hypothetical protein
MQPNTFSESTTAFLNDRQEREIATLVEVEIDFGRTRQSRSPGDTAVAASDLYLVSTWHWRALF